MVGRNYLLQICLISSSLQAPLETISEAWRAAIAAGVWLGVHGEGPVMSRAQGKLFEVQNEKTPMHMLGHGWYELYAWIRPGNGIKTARQCCILPTWKWISKMPT